MSVVIYAESRGVPAPTSQPPICMWFESLDGAEIVPIDGADVWRQVGGQGMNRPPQELQISGVPGAAGAALDDITVLTRPIFLPLAVVTDSQESSWEALRRLRRIVRHAQVTADGTFRLVCASPLGTRYLTVAYISGLESQDSGVPTFQRVPLQLLALDPYAHDVDPVSVPFALHATDAGVWPWTWPGALASSTVLGQDMPVEVASDVPVWPRLDFIGPLDPLTVTASTGMNLSVPLGVPSGSTLTVVTDPRAKSIRLNGARAAGRVARGSRIGEPFIPGRNLLTVIAPGADEESKVVVSWRGSWESLW